MRVCVQPTDIKLYLGCTTHTRTHTDTHTRTHTRTHTLMRNCRFLVKYIFVGSFENKFLIFSSLYKGLLQELKPYVSHHFYSS